MPAIVGVIERLHQPLYDTLCRDSGANPAAGGTAVQTQTRLFAGANLGQKA